MIWVNTWMKEKLMPKNDHHKRLVVKFRANSAAYIPHIDHVEKHLIQNQICNWSEVEGVAKNATLNPLIGKIGICDKLRSVAEKLKLVQSGEKRGDLSRYFVLENIEDADLVTLQAKIKAWPEVEKVEVVPTVGYPQAYLSAASEGIGALPVRVVARSMGEMVRVADIEGAWVLDHPAFGNLNLFPTGHMPWVSDPAVAEHGTNVLGVLCGSDALNQFSGIAPNLERVFVVSHGGSAGGVVQAILDAGAELLQAPPYTGIILLEAEFSKPGVAPYPCELDDYVFEAIYEVTQAGITVIEPAGNGDSNLSNHAALNPSHIDFRDSGAIVVAAGVRSPPNWKRWLGSNFGRRVDCFAAGETVRTATSGEAIYADRFGGTSSAAAIIAGVAAVTQSMALHITGTALQPPALRKLLQDSKFGTASSTNSEAGGGEWIGNMPDLALIAQHLNGAVV